MSQFSWLSPTLVFVGVLLTLEPCLAGGGPKNVLLVVNDNSPLSQRIAQYYMTKRGIPVRNVCHIQCSTNERVSKSECENNIVAPVRNFLSNSAVGDRIDYIVLTKGIPLEASYNDTLWWGPVSVTSVLTCVGVPSITSFCTNPYGPTAYPAAPIQYFTHHLVFSGKSYYIVTRLDAYTEEQVYRMIDDAVSAMAENGLFLMDGRYENDPNSANGKANTRLRQANHDLLTAGYSTWYDDAAFDSSIAEFVGGRQNVIGYFSWGSNETSYALDSYTSNYFLPGSIADGYVSTSGRTFTAPPVYGQSLIADLIPQGLTAGNGYVSEPDVRYASYPNVLFSRYIQGYNMGESFHAATPRLFWKSTTVGDPLMAPYATPPSVWMTSPDPSRTAHGMVLISADAADASGIRKVEFYVDDLFVSTCESLPYQFVWNTLDYTEGAHTVEAVAYENSNIFTQGMDSVVFDVRNIPLDVSTIGGLHNTEIGRMVRLTSKIVTAGTDAFVDCAYASEPNRTAGIRITGPFTVATGDVVTIEGELDIVDGQRTIEEAVVTVESPQPKTLMASSSLSGSAPADDNNQALRPFAVPNRFLANRGKNTGQEYSGLVPGLSNADLLVRTSGRVIEVGNNGFSISDGSMVRKKAIIQQVEVSLRNLTGQVEIPPLGSYVIVTGISCYTHENDLIRPTIRPRSAADIALVTQ